MTARYALFGSPIDGSPSPAMHNAAFAALRIDARYELHPAGVHDAERLISEMAARWRGANVTTPLKEAVAARVVCQGDAARARAVNTLWWRGGELVGSLTDVAGVREPLARRGVTGGEALLVGAGGAARAAVIALEQLGCTVHVAARRPEQARRLLDELGVAGEALELAQAGRRLGGVRVVVQATPLGRRDEPPPFDPSKLDGEAVVFEMLYRPRTTPLLAAAAARGCAVIEGWEMLLEQGACAFELWTATEPPRQVMQAALLDALSR